MNVELRNDEFRRVEARLRRAFNLLAMWFLLDKSGAGGLDNYEVRNENYGFSCCAEEIGV